MNAVKKIPDAVFCCLYRWMQTGGELDKVTLSAAVNQTSETEPVGVLVRKLEELRKAGYDDIQGAGYMSVRHPEQARERRFELVESVIGKSEAAGILKDSRVTLLFPPTPVGIKKTTLPLSVGLTGYDRQQDYTIKGHLPSNSLCSVYGPSGSYKSFLAVSWACHIAAGLKWSGKSVSGGSVLYIVGEGGIGVPRRIKAWENVYNDAVPLDNFYLVNRPVFPVRPDEANQVVIAAKQVEATTGEPVKFIVIDTLARCFGGNDENDARDMGAFIEGCDLIKRETGATLLVVHHSGKDEGKGARGSSAFRAALDAEFHVKREGDGGALVLTCTKMKDSEEQPQRAYDLRTAELFTDDDGELICSLVVIDVPREAKDEDPELSVVANLSKNHTALWQCIRSRTASGEDCTRALLRDDMIAMLGDNGRRGFNRWLEKLERDELIKIDGDEVSPLGRLER